MGQQAPRPCAPSCWRAPPRHDLEGRRAQELREPGILLRPMACVPQHRTGSDHQNASQIANRPVSRSGPSFCLPPVESFASGTIPDPGREVTTRSKNLWGSGTVAAIAVAPITPIPGMVLELLAALFPVMLHLDPLFDRSRSHSPYASSCAASTMTLARASIGNRVSCLSVMYGRRPRCKRNLTISEAFGCGHVFGL